MYTLSEHQIAFIADDIRARGIERVSLQHDLLDHVCCIIEDTFDGKDDFEGFYRRTIASFYEKELGEIEEETIRLLTFKNYYVMKKIMLGSGTASVAFLIAGTVFKFLHLPGAAIFLTLGVVLLSFLFLPLLFVLKVKEKAATADKIVLLVGMFCSILVTLGILFKMQHWPGANAMVIGSLAVLLLVFLPLYFYAGIRRAERKLNTIVTSMLIVSGAGLLLMLIRTPTASQELFVAKTHAFVREEQLVSRLRAATWLDGPAEVVFQKCQALKAQFIAEQTGMPTIPPDFEKSGFVLQDGSVGDYIHSHTAQVDAVRKAVEKYNATASAGCQISLDYTLFDTPQRQLTEALADLSSIQISVLTADRTTAMK